MRYQKTAQFTLAITVAVGLATTAASTSVSAHAAAAVPSTSCAALAPTQRVYYDGLGKVTGQLQHDTHGHVLNGYSQRFSVPGHPDSDLHQDVVPVGFDPTSAQPNVLQRYGIPTRPLEATARAHWNLTFGHPLSQVEPGMCVTHSSSALEASGNWSGPIKMGSTLITAVSGSWRQTGFTGSCPHPSAYSTWPGMGGTSGAGLTQAGTDVDPTSGTSAPYAWWEALSPTVGNPEVRFTSSSPYVSPGTVVDAEIGYTPGNGSLYFSVTGQNHIYSAGFTSYNGQTAAQYWGRATSAEWVNERPTYNGSFTDLRQPTFRTTAWGPGSIGGSFFYDGSSTQRNIATISPDSIYLVNNGHNLATVPYPFPQQNSWSDTWDACE